MGRLRWRVSRTAMSEWHDDKTHRRCRVEESLGTPEGSEGRLSDGRVQGNGATATCE